MPNIGRSPGTVTLIGSGEMSRTLGKVHRAVMSRITGPVHATFLDTPAGFQLNADQISARAVQYFQQHLNLDISVSSFKAAALATPAQVENAVRRLQQANYIFAGPGSPTYAIRNWRDTEISSVLSQQLAAGAHLVLASSAAIAIGRCALPVYEIYKVGEAPHWVRGLDLLGPYGLDLVIIPHWNNAEGGTHDTRYCFIGEPRMRLLEKRLSASTIILGIDEYTACILDLSSGECPVLGAGQVTVRQRGHDDRHYPAGTSLNIGELQVASSLDASRSSGEATPTEDPVNWIEWPAFADDEAESATPFIDLLIEVRARLREAGHWELADEIRQRLAELDITLEDARAETTWRRT